MQYILSILTHQNTPLPDDIADQARLILEKNNCSHEGQRWLSLIWRLRSHSALNQALKMPKLSSKVLPISKLM